MKRYLPFVIIIAVLLIALVVGRALYRSANTGAPTIPTATVNTSSSIGNTASAVRSPAVVLPGAQPPHVQGGQSARVTLEEFGDFQCPPCRVLHGELKKVEAEYGDRLRVIFRNFPLPRIHKHAVEAARAAEAAGMQNKFWEMHNRLYEDQSQWSDAPDARSLFIEYARFLGLDVERFRQDLDSQTASQRVTLDMQRGESLGVTGTPTVFLNNREVPYQQTSANGLRVLIEEALKQQK